MFNKIEYDNQLIYMKYGRKIERIYLVNAHPTGKKKTIKTKEFKKNRVLTAIVYPKIRQFTIVSLF